MPRLTSARTPPYPNGDRCRIFDPRAALGILTRRSEHRRPHGSIGVLRVVRLIVVSRSDHRPLVAGKGEAASRHS